VPRKSGLLRLSLSAVLIATAMAVAEPDPFTSPDAPSPHTASAASDAAPSAGSIGDVTAGFRDRVSELLVVAIDVAADLSAEAAAESADEAKPRLTKKERKAAKKEREAARKARKRAKQRAKPSTQRRLKLVKTFSGGLAPKSIVSAQNGRIFAMNMMYGHTVTVFNNRFKRIKTIPDTVDLSKFGFKQQRGQVQGAPVEAALNRKTGKMYVSNYSMYGPGFANQGFDLCTPRDRIDRSFVYEIDIKSLRKTDVIRVGKVPKHMAVTPNGRYLLVGNWCSWDISVVDLRKGKEVRRIEAGVAPRGMAFSPNGRTAYVTLVGEDRILVIDMKTFKVKRDIAGIGKRPRHLIMSPDGRFLYITVQGADKKKRADGRILKYDTRKRKVVARSKPLVEPRTTVMSRDGLSLYVVDYHPGKIVKLRAGNLKVIEDKWLGYHPIGVTYDLATDKLWVAGYGGNVWVLADR